MKIQIILICSGLYNLCLAEADLQLSEKDLPGMATLESVIQRTLNKFVSVKDTQDEIILPTKLATDEQFVTQWVSLYFILKINF